MNNNITMDELLKKYQEVCEAYIKELQEKYPEIVKEDREKIMERLLSNLYLITTFYKGNNIVKCYNEDKYRYLPQYTHTSDEVVQSINADEVVAFFDRGYCEIISKNKKIRMLLNDLFNPTPKYPKRDDSARITVEEITPKGIYRIDLSDVVKTTYFLNDDLLPLAQRIGCTVEECKFKYLHDYDSLEDDIRFCDRSGTMEMGGRISILHHLNIPRGNMPVLANILLKKDSMRICEDAHKMFSSLRTGQYPFIDANRFIDLTDKDIEPFIFNDEELRRIEDIKKSIENRALNGFEETPIQLEKENNDALSTNSSEKTNKIIEQLISLRDMGGELTPEQHAMINQYDKLNSEKFQQYKNNSQNREKRQKEIRDKIATENERKEKWYNSPENPTNKRIEELKHIKKQIQALESLSKIDDSLLSTEQRELIEHGKIFVDMVNTSQLLEHEVDTGMNPEIRSWYQEFYSNEEGKSRN